MDFKLNASIMILFPKMAMAHNEKVNRIHSMHLQLS